MPLPLAVKVRTLLGSRRGLAVAACGGVLLMLAGLIYWNRTTRPDYLLRQGRAALEQADGPRVLRIARRLEEHGHVDHLHLLRGEALLREGQALLQTTPVAATQEARARDLFRQALREVSRVRQDDPLASEATVLGAECLVHLDERRMAEGALRAVVLRRPDERDAHRWLAAIYIDLNTPFDAIAQLREWGRLDPDNGRPFRWIGFFYKDYSKPVEAIDAYREACRRRLPPPDRAEVVREWAETLAVAQADYQGALAVLDQCPEEFARKPDLLALRAECLWSLARTPDQLAGATRLADEVLRDKPDLVQALLLRARIYLTEYQPRDAVPLLEKAVRIDPHDHKCRQHLMEACRQLGDNARAEEQRKALEETKGTKDELTKLHEKARADPWDDSVRYQIATLCLKLDRKAEARTWLQAALACNPRNQPARQALERISQTAETPARPTSSSLQ